MNIKTICQALWVLTLISWPASFGQDSLSTCFYTRNQRGVAIYERSFGCWFKGSKKRDRKAMGQWKAGAYSNSWNIPVPILERIPKDNDGYIKGREADKVRGLSSARTDHSLLDMYMRAWEVAQARRKFTPSSYLIRSFWDEAFADQIYMWDTAFIMHFAIYAHRAFPGIQSFDNFYLSQYYHGGIPREIAERRPFGDFGRDTYTYAGFPNNVNPPIFAWSELRHARMHSDLQRLEDVHETLHKFYMILSGVSEQTYMEQARGISTTKKVQDLWGGPKGWIAANKNGWGSWYGKSRSSLRQGMREPQLYVRLSVSPKNEGLYWNTSFGSGRDNTPQAADNVFDEHERAWVDTSAKMALSFQNMVKIYEYLLRSEDAKDSPNSVRKTLYKERKTLYTTLRNKLVDKMRQKMWDPIDGMYYTLDKDGNQDDSLIHDNRGGSIKLRETANFWTILGGVATDEQVDTMVKKYINNPNEFYHQNGPSTVSSFHKNHSRHRPSSTGGPNASSVYVDDGTYWKGGVWAPESYQLIHGLWNRGHTGMAYKMAEQYVWAVWQSDRLHSNPRSSFYEVYDPDTVGQRAKKINGDFVKTGFVGWTGIVPISLVFEQLIGVDVNALHYDIKGNNVPLITWTLHRSDKHGVSRMPVGKKDWITLVHHHTPDRHLEVAVSGAMYLKVEIAPSKLNRDKATSTDTITPPNQYFTYKMDELVLPEKRVDYATQTFFLPKEGIYELDYDPSNPATPLSSD